MVEAFHNAFGIENRHKPTAELSKAQQELRYRLMAEENDEYLEAVKNNDLVEIADALGDQLYILCGTILKHGLQDKIAAVFKEIQRSNMSKLDADGKPIESRGGRPHERGGRGPRPSGPKRGKFVAGQRGRPGNIRHQGRKRK